MSNQPPHPASPGNPKLKPSCLSPVSGKYTWLVLSSHSVRDSTSNVEEVALACKELNCLYHITTSLKSDLARGRRRVVFTLLGGAALCFQGSDQINRMFLKWPFPLTIVSYGKRESRCAQAPWHKLPAVQRDLGLCPHPVVELVTEHGSLGKQRLARSIFKQVLLVSPKPLKRIMEHKVKLGSLCRCWRGKSQSPRQPNVQSSETERLEESAFPC